MQIQRDILNDFYFSSFQNVCKTRFLLHLNFIKLEISFIFISKFDFSSLFVPSLEEEKYFKSQTKLDSFIFQVSPISKSLFETSRFNFRGLTPVARNGRQYLGNHLSSSRVFKVAPEIYLCLSFSLSQIVARLFV